MPPRFDIEGRSHPQTLASFVSDLMGWCSVDRIKQHIQLDNVRPYASSLPGMFERLCQLQAKVSAPPVRGLPIRFFSSRKTALDRRTNGLAIFVCLELISKSIPAAVQRSSPVRRWLKRRFALGRRRMPCERFTQSSFCRAESWAEQCRCQRI